MAGFKVFEGKKERKGWGLAPTLFAPRNLLDYLESRNDIAESQQLLLPIEPTFQSCQILAHRTPCILRH
jgi:hypothetical protein